MKYAFSEVITKSDPSKAAAMYALMRGEGIIALSGGNPAKEAFPSKELEILAQKILQEDPVGTLQYAGGEGFTPLRVFMKEYVRKKFQAVWETDDLILTSGAQQAIDLVCRVLCNPNDTVFCDSVTFVGSINTFKVNNLNPVGVAMDESGMLPAALEDQIKKNPNGKLIYLIPNFHNPTGITMPLERRKALYQIAKKNNLIILEDNPYGEIRFQGEHIPAIKSLDEEGIVAYSGSFSKVVAPGLRTGYLIANQEIIDAAVMIKQFSDVHSSILPQRMCYSFFTEYDTASHIARISKLYGDKCKKMLDEIDAHFPKEVVCTRPEGGMFIWGTDTTKQINIDRLVKQLVEEEKVAIVPGDFFAVTETEKTHSFRVNFTVPSEQDIEIAIRRIGKVLKEKIR